jgi:hypothetical protein
MDSSRTFPEDLKRFIERERWTFAKTAHDWPHEYLVRDRVDETLFERLVNYIRAHGSKGRFYRKILTYYEEDSLLYWTMGDPVDETTIINRCRVQDSFEYRLKNGTLPRDRYPATVPEKGAWTGIVTLPTGYRADFKFGEYDPASDSLKVSDFHLSRLQNDQLTSLLKTTLNLRIGQTYIVGATKAPQSQRALMIVLVARK